MQQKREVRARVRGAGGCSTDEVTEDGSWEFLQITRRPSGKITHPIWEHLWWMEVDNVTLMKGEGATGILVRSFLSLILFSLIKLPTGKVAYWVKPRINDTSDVKRLFFLIAFQWYVSFDGTQHFMLARRIWKLLLPQSEDFLIIKFDIGDEIARISFSNV